MTHEDAFLQSILEKPEDDVPRLIYADWLEEHGQTARAEFIRVQIELARLPEVGPRRDELEDRQRKLLREHEPAWAGALRPLVRWWQFRRGFVEAVNLHATEFLRDRDAILRAAPVRDVRLGYVDSGLAAELAACPSLGNVSDLLFHTSHLGDVGLRELVSSPYLARARLRSLELCETGIGPEGLASLLATSDRFPQLTDLGLALNELGCDSVEALAASPLAARLRRLRLGACERGPAGVLPIANSPAFAGLTHLSVGATNAGDPGCEALAAAPHLFRLIDLDVMTCEVGDRGVEALANSDHLCSLVMLNLSCNPLTAVGVKSLVMSANAARLRVLELGHNRIGERGARALAVSPHLGRLQRLGLDHCEVGDGGAQALASSPTLAGLRQLELAESGITVKGLRALTRSAFWPHLVELRLLNNPVGDEGAALLLSVRPPPRLTSMSLVGTGISRRLHQALRAHFGEQVRFYI